uniref:COMM domain-containing protein n=1 Tax=Gongylonema pulchrum TaxID=637853 RepID=A0A183EQY5_9BILA
LPAAQLHDLGVIGHHPTSVSLSVRFRVVSSNQRRGTTELASDVIWLNSRNHLLQEVARTLRNVKSVIASKIP